MYNLWFSVFSTYPVSLFVVGTHVFSQDESDRLTSLSRVDTDYIPIPKLYKVNDSAILAMETKGICNS